MSQAGQGAVLLAVALSLVGCAPQQSEPIPATSDTPTQPVVTEAPPLEASDIPAGFEDWYNQAVDWGPCERDFDCAQITAPLSWDDPDAGSINLKLIRHAATGTKIGTLLVNPGGPGGSGLGFLPYAYPEFGKPVKDAYDVMSFDPRGVGESTPIVCLDDAGKDEFISADFDDDEAGREAMAAANAAWGQACYENTGPLLATVDTMSAARDMDLMRHLVGDPKLNYLGFSYGTQLGATYAGIFPERVGRLVLDGAIDLTLTADEMSFGQAVGFETALRNFVADCPNRDTCQLQGTVDDALAEIAGLLARTKGHPLPTRQPARTLNRTLAFYGIALALYDNESWPYLDRALNEAFQGNGDTLLFLADFYNDRNPDGTFSSNSTEAFQAIGCVDSRGTEDPAEMDALAAEVMAAAPTVGEFFTYGGLVCRDWPVPLAPGSFDLHAAGAPPILVIGTTNDPATPFSWAEGLANTLDSGVLLIYDGEGHTAYTRSNACIADTVDEFLVDDIVPPAGKRC